MGGRPGARRSPAHQLKLVPHKRKTFPHTLKLVRTGPIANRSAG